MRVVTRILSIWIVCVVLMLASFALPHHESEVVSVFSNSIQLLLCITSISLVKHESVKKTKYIFVNFAVLFSLSVFFHASNFIGTLFLRNESLARIFFYQYVSEGLYTLLLAVAVCYVTVDVLFRDFSTLRKYLLTFAVVGGFFLYYYQPILADRMYLYKTDEIAEWKELDRASSEYMNQFRATPTEQQLASYITKDHAARLFQLTDGERRLRIAALYPYLLEENYLTLLVKPLNLNGIHMGVLCLGLILLFFGYLYRKDPPQGAYIEKMMFLLLILVSLEIFHNWNLMKIVEWESSLRIIEVGEFLSAAVLSVIALFFILRLRFITTVYGEFYEHEIVESPLTITRWRDAFDNYVIRHFFSGDEFAGRFLVDPKMKKLENA